MRILHGALGAAGVGIFVAGLAFPLPPEASVPVPYTPPAIRPAPATPLALPIWL